MTFSEVSDKAAALLFRLVNDSNDLFLVAGIALVACCILLLVYLFFPGLYHTPHSKALVPQPGPEVIVLGKHEHGYAHPYPIEDAPIGGGRHTIYSVLVCHGCMTAVTFPQDNFLLTTSEHQEWLKTGLADMGITLVTE
jgi:hypothetical protein